MAFRLLAVFAILILFGCDLAAACKQRPLQQLRDKIQERRPVRSTTCTTQGEKTVASDGVRAREFRAFAPPTWAGSQCVGGVCFPKN